MFRTKAFLIPFSLFIVLHVVLYLFITFFHTEVPFDKNLYFNHSHHYVQDPRATDGGFHFLRTFGSWDAQWYLRIADNGYPSWEVIRTHMDPRFMGALTYAFFPLYPLILAIFNVVFRDIELTAFIVMNILLIANFISLYYIVTKLFSQAVAVRTIFLLFLFPFSIFYRFYFTEGIFLLLLLWFSYFLIKHKWFYSTVMASLLFVTRPNGAFMGIVLAAAFYKAIRAKKFSWKKAFFYLSLSMIPFAIWCLWTLSLTGNPFYWHKVQSVWFSSPSLGFTFVQNIEHILGFFDYPIHGSRESKLDVLMVIIVFGMLLWSRKFFKKYPQLWWISVLIWIAPLILKDLMSYSRYQIISFPLFIFLAAKATGWKFYVLCALFLGFLLFTSLYLVNWQWVG